MERGLRVAIIGAGVSGICLGVKLREAGITDFLIFEKSDGVGGTWRDNTYPGAGCDVPSLLYSFSFAPNPDWSRAFSPQQEILAYLDRVTDQFGVRPHLRVRTEVTSAVFDEPAGLWRLRLADGATYTAQVLVSGVGQLNRPAFPNLPGQDSFQGTTFHSARWNHDHDLRGQRIGVIGNGASAIQFIPVVAEQAERLVVFQRSANWMIPRNDRTFTLGEKVWFARHPHLRRALRFLVWASLEARWPAFASSRGMVARRIERQARTYLDAHVSSPALRAALTPDYPVGCKRILISDDYFQAIVRPNVEVVTTPITAVTRDGITTADGAQRTFDTLIYATGFKTTEFLAPIDIRGAGGRPLVEAWRGGAEAYLGVALAGFPNFFMLYGPNTNLGHNSIIFMIERQVEYVMRAIRRLHAGECKTLAPRVDAMAAYNREIQQSLAQSVWATGCESWYKTSSGKITNNWAHGTISYWWRTRRPRWSDFEIVPAR